MMTDQFRQIVIQMSPLKRLGAPFAGKASTSEVARHTLRYVEPLSDTKAPLADVFSILLDINA
jgi:hypothetical protein